MLSKTNSKNKRKRRAKHLGILTNTLHLDTLNKTTSNQNPSNPNLIHLFKIIDDAVKLTSELHNSNARMNHLHKKKERKDLTESTGVVPAKYLSKAKLELFS